MRFEYFQMIDRMVALDVAGRSARSICTVPQTSHDIRRPLSELSADAGALLLECMAQTTGWLLIAIERF